MTFTLGNFIYQLDCDRQHLFALCVYHWIYYNRKASRLPPLLHTLRFSSCLSIGLMHKRASIRFDFTILWRYSNEIDSINYQIRRMAYKEIDERVACSNNISRFNFAFSLHLLEFPFSWIFVREKLTAKMFQLNQERNCFSLLAMCYFISHKQD